MDWQKLKLGSWAAIGGAIITAYIGFNVAGWMTQGGADVMAKETAAAAVAERLGTICVAQFNQDTAKGQKLAEMKGKDTWEISRYIEKQSWVIMPGDERVERGVADACAGRLSKQS